MEIKTILVPTDFSDNAKRAFTTGYRYAEHFGAKLVVLHVQDESSLRIAVREGLFQDDCNDDEIRARVKKLIESRFTVLLAGHENTRVTIEHLTKRGDPKVVVVDYGREVQADLIVVGMQGISALEALTSIVIGSVADSVIRKSHCPTLVVKLAS
jgi:nucleotide-binding universal stress UspA family protein